MTVKVSEKNVAARWIQAAAITFVLYLIMGMSQSQSASTGASRMTLEWQSAPPPAKLGVLTVEMPTLSFLLK